MDGHWVPNITVGPVVVRGIAQAAKVPLEAHLMISEPARYAEAFAKAGASAISFHPEAVDEPHGVLNQLKSLGVRAGSPSIPIPTSRRWRRT